MAPKEPKPHPPAASSSSPSTLLPREPEGEDTLAVEAIKVKDSLLVPCDPSTDPDCQPVSDTATVKDVIHAMYKKEGAEPAATPLEPAAAAKAKALAASASASASASTAGEAGEKLAPHEKTLSLPKVKLTEDTHPPPPKWTSPRSKMRNLLFGKQKKKNGANLHIHLHKDERPPTWSITLTSPSPPPVTTTSDHVHIHLTTPRPQRSTGESLQVHFGEGRNPKYAQGADIVPLSHSANSLHIHASHSFHFDQPDGAQKTSVHTSSVSIPPHPTDVAVSGNVLSLTADHPTVSPEVSLTGDNSLTVSISPKNSSEMTLHSEGTRSWEGLKTLPITEAQGSATEHDGGDLYAAIERIRKGQMELKNRLDRLMPPHPVPEPDPEPYEDEEPTCSRPTVEEETAEVREATEEVLDRFGVKTFPEESLKVFKLSPKSEDAKGLFAKDTPEEVSVHRVLEPSHVVHAHMEEETAKKAFGADALRSSDGDDSSVLYCTRVHKTCPPQYHCGVAAHPEGAGLPSPSPAPPHPLPVPPMPSPGPIVQTMPVAVIPVTHTHVMHVHHFFDDAAEAEGLGEADSALVQSEDIRTPQPQVAWPVSGIGGAQGPATESDVEIRRD
uniref:Uncharacterized protein n=1 Tax=Chromera velia CCMP2878 TaxID=1169474 RepID=A0A0G4FEK9_9ALVE|eukprot:Cvel_16537.t1-p1 / transcript=Cvel_16537.t1 / gene=Cvel_16537 / organism=Chromera_velia_CCMP2878 / gene_product=hypothetical protein / transcript_product=hypothetical protein / location=Cvel_scaffold1278:5562-8330(+) / protein_length=612 / sequence_SO=supercontig / SO=protein_coding / is_pseudo=false